MAKSESECPYKEGYLWFPPHGVLTQLKVNCWHFISVIF